VNITKTNQATQQVVKQPEIMQQQPKDKDNQLVPTNMIKTKNMPNGLLRRATGNNQGTQRSIGSLSNYNGRGPNYRNITNQH
jgi:hypothetical protein